MSENQFVVETVEITDCDTDVSRIAKVITDTKETYSYEDLDEIVHKLNEQQDTIRKLQDLCGESDGENAKLRLKSKELQEEIKLLKPTNIEQYEQIQKLQEENEYFRKSRDKWKTKALQKDEQLKDCDNDCFNCRFYNKVCDFCTKFHIYTMSSGDKDG